MTVSYPPPYRKKARIVYRDSADTELDTELYTVGRYVYHSGCLELNKNDTVMLIPWDRIAEVTIEPYDREPDPIPLRPCTRSRSPTERELLDLILDMTKRPRRRNRGQDYQRSIADRAEECNEWRWWAESVAKLAAVIRSHGPS